jgi:NAD(P)-dependent dehydrogenase (short-subunit alcohol dehydrogenase family)
MSRTVVITGATAGVGRATARAFARRGDRIALVARSPEQLEATARELRSAGAAALLALPCDVSDHAAVDAAATRAEAELGPIDVWVNDAMVAVLAFSWETEPSEFRRVTEVNYLGTVNGTLAALHRMRPRDRGVIVQVGSALSYRAIPLQATYCASKFAIRGFTDSVRTELRHDGSGVRITMVQLPGLNTPQFTWVRARVPRRPRPVAPVYQPEVAADAIVWASRHPRRELWVGASTVAVIAGSKLFGDLADRYLARTNVEAQQTDEALPADRPDYVDAPLPDDRGAHGPFDDEAKTRSVQLSIAKLRSLLRLG